MCREWTAHNQMSSYTRFGISSAIQIGRTTSSGCTILKGASWETQHAIEVGSPTPWAPAVRHENSRVLLSYATDNNLALEPINDISTNTTTAKLGLEGYESDEHVQSDKLKRAMNELRALAAQTNHSWLWASVYSGSDSDGEE